MKTGSKRQPTITRTGKLNMDSLTQANLAAERRRANYIKQQLIDDMEAEAARKAQESEGGIVDDVLAFGAGMLVDELLRDAGGGSGSSSDDSLFAGLGGESAGGGSSGDW